MNYIHNESCSKDIVLHDCKAVRAELCDGTLSFFFEDGFWISPTHPESDCETLVRTDASRVDYNLGRGIVYDVIVYAFEKHFGKTVRKVLSIEKLIEDINRKKCSIEFLYQYADENDGDDRIIECVIWQDRKPFHRECVIKIYSKEVVYRWNEIRADAVW